MKKFQQPSVMTPPLCQDTKPPTLTSPDFLSSPPPHLSCSLQYSLIADKERSDGHPGGLLPRGNSPLQLHGRRSAAHVTVSPSIHQRFPEADPGGI